jgi:hypothetical protein
MSKKKYIWKVQLKQNLLTTDNDNDYIAEVLTVGDTARNEDVAQAIIAEGSEFKYGTLLSILNQSDRIKRSFIVGGRGIRNSVSQIKQRVNGYWDGANAKYDPNKIIAQIMELASGKYSLSVITEYVRVSKFLLKTSSRTIVFDQTLLVE